MANIISRLRDDQDIKLYDYNHINLEFAENQFVPGDRVLKTSHDDPDTAIVVEEPDGDDVTVVFKGQLDGEEVHPSELSEYCTAKDLSTYSYSYDELELVRSY